MTLIFQIAFGIVLGVYLLKVFFVDSNNEESSGLWLLAILPLIGFLVFDWIGLIIGIALDILIYMLLFNSDGISKTISINQEINKKKEKYVLFENFFADNLLNWIILILLLMFGLLLLLGSLISIFSGESEGWWMLIPSSIFLIPCFFIIKKIKSNNKKKQKIIG